MSASRPQGELRRAATELITEKLKSIRPSEAARTLKVSRQAIYGIKKGNFCPSMAVIQRACEAWNLEFTVRGMKVSASSFKSGEPEIRPREQSVPFQPTLFDLWSELYNQRMTVVRAERVDGAVEMTLRISIPA